MFNSIPNTNLNIIIYKKHIFELENYSILTISFRFFQQSEKKTS